MAIIDVNSFHDGSRDCLKNISDIDIRSRRALVLTHLSKCTFTPNRLGYGRGEGSFIPDKHQLIPLDTFRNPWLNDIFSIEEDNENRIQIERRKYLIMADEGGMGKTYSSVVVAMDYYNKHKGSIVVLCPPMISKNWEEAFSRCGIPLATSNASILTNGLKDGVTIISKYSLLNHPLTENTKERLRDKITLCILDEGHNGMLTNNEDTDRQLLRRSIKTILDISKNNLIATATPMQRGWRDLETLLKTCIDDESDLQRLQDFDFDNNWFEELNQRWLPTLEKLSNGNLTSSDVTYLCQKAEDMIPWLSNEELETLRNNLPIMFEREDIPEFIRARIARDLHPFGKYISISRRDDLGRAECDTLYRKQLTMTHRINISSNLDECINYFDEKGWDYSRGRNILISNPENVLKIKKNGESYYKTLQKIDEKDERVIELCRKASQSDKRYEILERICEEVKLSHAESVNKKMGVVIFCNHIGTVEKITDWCKKDERSYHVFNLLEMDEERNEENSKKQKKARMKTLRKAEESSLDNSNLTVMVCGKNASVGLNMAWANHVVHWDLEYGSVETICQRTWRLDRRWNGSIEIEKEFCVSYFVLEDKITDAKEANQKYKNNRIVLGDRRFINSQSTPNLFDTRVLEQGLQSSPDPVINDWTLEPREDSLTDYDVQAIWEWISNPEFIDISGISERLWLHSLKQTVGLNLDITESEIHIGDKFEEQSYRNIGISNCELHDLVAMSSPEESRTLQFIATRHKKVNSLMTRYGAPNVNTNFSVTNLLPTSTLASKIIDLLREMYTDEKIKFDYYPYFIDDDTRDISYAIHLGVLDLLGTERGRVFTSVLGPNMPSGIIINEDDEGWRHILKSDLDEHLEIFNFILDDASIEIYSFGLPTRNLERDVHKFLDMSDYREKFDHYKKAAKIPYDDMIILVEEEDEINFKEMSDKTDMIPLVRIGAEVNRAPHNGKCRICGLEKCLSDDCDAWDAVDTDGWWKGWI